MLRRLEPLPDDTLPRGHSWNLGSGGTVTAQVYGGNFRVDTGELHSLAGLLGRAVELSDRSGAHVDAAQWTLEDAARQSLLHAGGLELSTVPSLADLQFQAQQHSLAQESLWQLARSQQGLREELELLGQDILASADRYEQAEAAAGTGWSTDIAALRGLSLGLRAATPVPGLLIDSGAIGAGLDLLSESTDLKALLGDDLAVDVFEHLRTLLADQGLAAWASADLLAIVVVAALAARATQKPSGKELSGVEEYLRQASQRLDPVVSARLPQTIWAGSQRRSTADLSPMQRVAAYLAILSATSGAARFGKRNGIRLSPRSGAWVGAALTIPPALKDPYGLNSRIQTQYVPAAGEGRRLTPPGSPSEVMRYSDSLKQADDDTSTGVISLLRTNHADGTRSWLVVIPGTTHWSSGGSNPQDMLTNFEAVAGMPTDMESAVVSAMRAAGVGAGDPVALYGHSQGAITAANLAADAGVHTRFNVTAALTVGGPVAGAAIPASVHTLHVENASDAVPALDATSNRVTPTRTTVVLNTSTSHLAGYPHASLVYADALDNMPQDPAIEAWSRQLARITGSGEEGAHTTEIVFDIERLHAPRQDGAIMTP